MLQKSNDEMLVANVSQFSHHTDSVSVTFAMDRASLKNFLLQEIHMCTECESAISC